ncbi:hypothetical protein BH23ACT8_BH23ACT8_24730 [soil metagenome]
MSKVANFAHKHQLFLAEQGYRYRGSRSRARLTGARAMRP